MVKDGEDWHGFFFLREINVSNWGHFSKLELEFGNVGFWGEGKTGVPGKKPFGAETRTNNKLDPHITPSPGIETGTHWWEASALTTAARKLHLEFSREMFSFMSRFLLVWYSLSDIESSKTARVWFASFKCSWKTQMQWQPSNTSIASSMKEC